MDTFIVLVICVALAFIAASMAVKRGYSYGGLRVFGFFMAARCHRCRLSER